MVCVACGWSELEGALFCSRCTSPLVKEGRPAAKAAPAPKKAASLLAGQDSRQEKQDTSRLTFVFADSGRRVGLALTDRISIGRSDPIGGYSPELDLEEHEGAQSGVSRSHAVIERNHLGIVLTDLGSTNGTRLNNFDLPPDLPYALHHGDEIYFGHLLVHVFFE
jgi:pSer/pThr/pTyr-binding forkhead associated (FHA) protein